MRFPGARPRLIASLFLLLVPFLAAETPDIQHLRDEYIGKPRILRGFYSGDHLKYNSSGLVGRASVGDWTTDGVVVIQELSVAGDNLSMKASRVLVSNKGEFTFLEGKKPKEKKWERLKIEIVLGSGEISAAQWDAALAKVFLTSDDDFVSALPDYWQDCINQALVGAKTNCRLSKELIAIPGVTVQNASKLATDRADNAERLQKVGNGVTPPRTIYSPEPAFPELARETKYQGTITLGLVVTKEGIPSRIHILFPLGCGLDAQAVRTVQTWRFDPARKDGQPVPVEIHVEVLFHLY